MYRAIGSLLARVLEHLPEAPVDDNGDGEGHTHYSLAQMLLSGAVEGISDFPPLVYAPVVLTFSIRLSSTFVVACDFDPQTASRAPPVRS